MPFTEPGRLEAPDVSVLPIGDGPIAADGVDEDGEADEDDDVVSDGEPRDDAPLVPAPLTLVPTGFAVPSTRSMPSGGLAEGLGVDTVGPPAVTVGVPETAAGADPESPRELSSDGPMSHLR